MTDTSAPTPTTAVLGDVQRIGARPSPVGSGDERDRYDLSAIARGDLDALGRLMERHQVRIGAFVRRFTATDDGLAEEVVQDTWVAVWRHAAQYRGTSRVTTWLCSIAKNSALARLRTRRLEIVDAGDLDDRRDGRTTVEDAALARADLASIRPLMAALPDRQQVIILLAFVEELSYREIGDVLDLPVGTVKSRVSRVRSQLAAVAPGWNAA